MSSQFRRICLANFFLFISVYLLFPVLPVAMANQLDVTIAEAGYLFVFMITGRIMAGLFVNYLVDAFKRKYLCITSLTIMLIATAVYWAIDTKTEALLVAFIQGVSFGVISASLITVSIDITPSEYRNKANVILGWTTRLAMLIGIGTGSFLFQNTGFLNIIYASLLCGSIAIISLFLLKIPFRAPIGSALISFDRFLLPRGWVLSVNMIMISFIPGIFIPLIHYKIESSLIVNGWVVPYFVLAIIGFMVTWYFKKYIKKSNEKITMMIGMTLLLLSVSLFMIFDVKAGVILSGVLLGISLGLITPLFLMMFIELSNHCERASANTTNLLSWGTGLATGLFVSCYLTDNYSSLLAYQTALFLASLALIYFIIFTYPYYLKKKVR